MRSSACSLSRSWSPASAPRAMATATAWFSVTTGLSDICIRSSYTATICGQSVASAFGASSWTAAIAAWSWYGPTGPLGPLGPLGSAEVIERVIWHALLRPLLRRRDQRLLDGILGRVEMAVTPDDGAQGLRRQLAQQVLQGLPKRAARVAKWVQRVDLGVRLRKGSTSGCDRSSAM